MMSPYQREKPRQQVYLYRGQNRDDFPDIVTHVDVDWDLTEIPQEGFYDSEDLELIMLPMKLRIIGVAAFYNCRKLRYISPLPPSLREIQNHAFYGCRMLRRIHLPEGLRVIGYAAFFRCWALKELIIPSTIREIHDSAFVGCRGLESLLLPEGLQVIREQTFAGCTGLLRMKIPSTVKCIEDRAFHDCKMLYSLELSVDVTIEGFEVFHGCENLTNIFIDGKSPFLEIEDDTPQCDLFEYCNKLYEQFPNDHCLEQSLQNRFKGLPIHRLCYFQASKPQVKNIKSLGSSLFRGVEPYYETGDKQDTFGMTPLHILSLSVMPNLPLIRDFVEKFPDTPRTKDRWGRQPIFYALLSHSSADSIEALKFLLRSTVSKELKSLGLEKWRADIISSIEEFRQGMDLGEKFNQLPEVIERLHHYELMEWSSLLELALWKAKWDESKSNKEFIRKGRKRSKTATDKTTCRVVCGAEVIVPNVLPFLKDSHCFQGLTCINGSNFQCF